MAQMKALLAETFDSAAAMASRHRFCKFTAEYTINYCALGEGQLAIGVNFDTAAAADRGVQCTTIGTCKVEAGAAITAGALVKPDAVGRAIAAVATDSYCGRARQAATALGDIIEVFLEHGEMD